MIEKLPLVSVCIPSYKYGNYIAAAVESVLCQTYGNLELIIVDDCSGDDTEEIVQHYVARNKNIRFYTNEKNLGMVENWNRCLELVRGDFVKVMGADDILEPLCIEKSAAVLMENPGVALVSCARLFIDKDTHPLKTVAYANKRLIAPGRNVLKRCFFTGNIIGEPVAALFRTKDAARKFNAHYRQLTDLEMWFYLLEKGDFAFIPEPLCKFRVHQSQTTKANVASLTFINDELLLYRDYIKKEYLGESIVHKQLWKLKLCYTIWSHKAIGLDIAIIRSEIRKYMPLYIFYPLVYLVFMLRKAIGLLQKKLFPCLMAYFSL